MVAMRFAGLLRTFSAAAANLCRMPLALSGVVDVVVVVVDVLSLKATPTSCQGRDDNQQQDD